MSEITEQTTLVHATRRLIQEPPGVSPADVDAVVGAALVRSDHCPIRDFVPLFIEKHARQRLTRPHPEASA